MNEYVVGFLSRLGLQRGIDFESFDLKFLGCDLCMSVLDSGKTYIEYYSPLEKQVRFDERLECETPLRYPKQTKAITR